MATKSQELHFVLFPLMAQGHTIPMVDIARLLSQRRVIVTIITTPLNAYRLNATIARASKSGLQIRVVELYFPCVEAGLPEGCENFDDLLSITFVTKFFVAASMLQGPVEQLLGELEPRPSCLISDMSFPWTTQVALEFGIPRIVFHGTCCFPLLCGHKLLNSRVLDDIASDSDPFVVPGLPIRIELTKAQLPSIVNPNPASATNDFWGKVREAENAAYGVVFNTFEEMEKEYVKEYTRVKGKKVWCIGPVSLCSKSNLDKADRGNRSSIDERHCLKWLDLREPGSVLYACLGSLSRLTTSQMIELGLGMEASNRPFIWCVRSKSEELERWISEGGGFEERTKGRGLLIFGWAPQVLILSHPSIGGFLTHCGWNSTVEGVCAGVPMMTWPMFAEQFLNEKLVVEVLRIGLRAGVEVPVLFGEEEKVGVLLKKNDVKVVVDKLMDGGEEGEERKKRVREIGDMAKKAMEEGGSSHFNMTLLIQDIMEQANG